jgi:hypothetical protein
MFNGLITAVLSTWQFSDKIVSGEYNESPEEDDESLFVIEGMAVYAIHEQISVRCFLLTKF